MNFDEIIRIGSDEDDEEADEAASTTDPYETAVSRDAERERCGNSGIASTSAGSLAQDQSTQSPEDGKADDSNRSLGNVTVNSSSSFENATVSRKQAL